MKRTRRLHAGLDTLAQECYKHSASFSLSALSSTVPASSKGGSCCSQKMTIKSSSGYMFSQPETERETEMETAQTSQVKDLRFTLIGLIWDTYSSPNKVWKIDCIDWFSLITSSIPRIEWCIQCLRSTWIPIELLIRRWRRGAKLPLLTVPVVPQ